MKKLRHVEVEFINRGHTVRKGISRTCVSKRFVILPQYFFWAGWTLEMIWYNLFSFLRWVTENVMGAQFMADIVNQAASCSCAFWHPMSWESATSIKKGQLVLQEANISFL